MNNATTDKIEVNMTFKMLIFRSMGFGIVCPLAKKICSINLLKNENEKAVRFYERLFGDGMSTLLAHSASTEELLMPERHHRRATVFFPSRSTDSKICKFRLREGGRSLTHPICKKGTQSGAFCIWGG